MKKLFNVAISVELIVEAENEEQAKDVTLVRRELEEAIKNGRWTHISRVTVLYERK